MGIKAVRVAVIGLGDIARKAYLPVITGMAGLELVLCSRDREQLERLARTYRVSETTTQVAELASMQVDAAFVHAATAAHEPIVTQLLEHGIHVYVDKPLAYTLDAANRMVSLAQSRGRLLRVGFNRRYAPLYRRLADVPQRRLAILQKNRCAQPEVARRFVLDDFIHVVDTLRLLAPGAVTEVSVRSSIERGLLHHVVLQLDGRGFTLIGIMNRDSGSDEETLELMAPGDKWRVLNLAQLTHSHAGLEQSAAPGNWESVLWRRGFPQIIEHFLADVRTPPAVDTAAHDALATHALCEQIVVTLEAAGAAPMDSAGSC